MFFGVGSRAHSPRVTQEDRLQMGIDKQRNSSKAAVETLVAVKKRMAFDGHSPIASTTRSGVNSIIRTWQDTASRTT